MSLKQWLALLSFYVTYLFLGASIFYHIESRLELARRQQDRVDRYEIHALFSKYNFPDDPTAQYTILNKLTDFCGRSVFNYTEADDRAPFVWDFYHSFFFSYTVASTVGYGNLAPNSTLGRMIMIVYALFGMPVHGILLTQLSQYFGRTFTKLYKKYKSHKSATNSNYEVLRLGLVGQVLLYLIPGVTFFIFIPACLFVLFEDWDYDIAVYYAFVTLTTIGFGDYVAGMQDKGYGAYFVMYKIFLIFWMTFGLGYILMCMGFILRGLKSKRLARLEHKLANNIKQTHERIWNGVTRDVGYLRRILNELYLVNFKPVYKDDISVTMLQHGRSQSCPDLTMYSEPSPIPCRRRANSESQHDGTGPVLPDLVRVQSDSELDRVDKTRTFGRHGSIVQPSELLACVVGALGDLAEHDEDRDGLHGFDDEEILSSEKTGSMWSIPPRIPRNRAASEYRIRTNRRDDYSDPSNEWTWSGPAANAKLKELLSMRNAGRESFSFPVPERKPLPAPLPVMPEDSLGPPSKSLLGRLNPFRNRRGSCMPSMVTPSDVESGTGMALNARQYVQNTQRGRCSVFSLPPEGGKGSLLEETSVADLIRALNALHEQDGGPFQPKRKYGTASLTPPQMPMQPRPRRLSLRPAGFITAPSTSNSRRPSVAPSPQQLRRNSLLPPPPPYMEEPLNRSGRRFSVRMAPEIRRSSLRHTPSPLLTSRFDGRRSSLRPSAAMGPVQRSLNARLRFKNTTRDEEEDEQRD